MNCFWNVCWRTQPSTNWRYSSSRVSPRICWMLFTLYSCLRSGSLLGRTRAARPIGSPLDRTKLILSQVALWFNSRNERECRLGSGLWTSFASEVLSLVEASATLWRLCYDAAGERENIISFMSSRQLSCCFFRRAQHTVSHSWMLPHPIDGNLCFQQKSCVLQEQIPMCSGWQTTNIHPA